MKPIFRNPLWILLLICLVSCHTYHPLSEQNYFNGSILYNEPLELRFDYFGDIDFEALDRSKRKEIRSMMKGINRLKTEDVLAYGRTTMNPEYRVLLLMKDSGAARQDSSAINLLLKDTLNNRVLYEKTHRNRLAYLLLKAGRNNKNIRTITSDGLTLMKSLDFDSDFEEVLSYSEVFGANRESPNELMAREKLKTAPVPANEQSEWMQFQFLATVNSFMANNPEYDELLAEFEGKRKAELKPVVDSLLKHPEVPTNTGVVARIANLASDTQVVMLNENHWYPKHRLLGMQLLEPLKERGYTHLALEALFEGQDSLLNARGFPTYASGYYTRETYFGHFIREASALGFSIVEYENREEGRNRELGQAQNLARLFEEEPGAKIFVYAGIDHIIEEPTARGKSMAALFKEITGVDPLTINQVEVVSDRVEELAMIPYALVSDHEKLQKKKVDYFVINNLEPELGEVFQEQALKEVVVKEEVFEKHVGETVLVKVYALEEYHKHRTKSVPLVSTLRTVAADGEVVVELPSGDYMLRVFSVGDDKLALRVVRSYVIE